MSKPEINESDKLEAYWKIGRGVSVANLKNFRQFYLTFPEIEKGYALRSQLTWTHWRTVRCAARR